MKKKKACVHKACVCNICGKEMSVWDKEENFSMYKHLGYGSEFDLNIMDIHICCDCMDKIIKSCKVSPLVGTYDLIGFVE